MEDCYEVKPIGVLRSKAKLTSDLPLGGCAAEAHIFAEYESGLQGIEDHSHIMVFFWLHDADRSLLQVHPRRFADLPLKGVFALRAPVRPNPIALCVSPLGEREGNIIHLKYIDVIDGTPILDLKPYVPAWECIQSAYSAGEGELQLRMEPAEALNDLIRQATNFHGSLCVGGAIGARAAYKALRFFKGNLRDPRLKIVCETRACIADALQGAAGAGLKRLKKRGNTGRILFKLDDRQLELRITGDKFSTVNEVLKATDEELFTEA